MLAAPLKAIPTASMRSVITKPRLKHPAPYTTIYVAYVTAMRDRFPELVITRRGPPISFEQWSRGQPPDAPA